MTHTDATGMLWRFDGSRPISELADEVMAGVRELRLLPTEDELKEVMAPFYVPPPPTIRMASTPVRKVLPHVPVPNADEMLWRTPHD